MIQAPSRHIMKAEAWNRMPPARCPIGNRQVRPARGNSPGRHRDDEYRLRRGDQYWPVAGSGTGWTGRLRRTTSTSPTSAPCTTDRPATAVRVVEASAPDWATTRLLGESQGIEQGAHVLPMRAFPENLAAANAAHESLVALPHARRYPVAHGLPVQLAQWRVAGHA